MAGVGSGFAISEVVRGIAGESDGLTWNMAIGGISGIVGMALFYPM